MAHAPYETHRTSLMLDIWARQSLAECDRKYNYCIVVRIGSSVVT